MRKQLRGLRQLVVYHLADVYNIQAPGGHVGCHQDTDPAATEVGQYPFSGALGEIALQGINGIAHTDQLISQLPNAVLGLAKDKDGIHLLLVQQFPQRIKLGVGSIS